MSTTTRRSEIITFIIIITFRTLITLITAIMLIIDTGSTTTDTTKKHTARAMCTRIALVIASVLKNAQEKSHAEYALRVLLLTFAVHGSNMMILLSINKAIKR